MKFAGHTICGRSRESLPMVLNTKSCSLLTMPKRSSPRDAIVTFPGSKLPGGF